LKAGKYPEETKKPPIWRFNKALIFNFLNHLQYSEESDEKDDLMEVLKVINILIKP
jgi:hypothetical protein